MLTTSLAFDQAIQAGAEQDIRIVFDNGLGLDKKFISASGGLQYQQILNRDGDLQMGKTVMSTLELTLIDIDGSLPRKDFSQEFTVEYGVNVGGVYQYVQIGVFRAERTEKGKNRHVKVYAVDRMSMFDSDASELIESLKFPVSVKNIMTEICGWMNLELGSLPIRYHTTNIMAEKNPFTSSDYTFREVLAWIAEVYCSYAVIDAQGRLSLRFFDTEPRATFTRNNHYGVTFGEIACPPIERLEVYTSYSDMLSSSGASSGNLYVISDNPLLYAENDEDKGKIQSFVDDIFEDLSQMPEYYPASVRMPANPKYECGDVICVNDINVSRPFPIFMKTLKWNGSGVVEYECTGNPKRETTPIQQRELENLKKNMLKTSDLYTKIESYLDTESGKASIIQSVGGTFVTQLDFNTALNNYPTNEKLKQELGNYVQTSTLDASIQSYITGDEGKAELITAVSGAYVTEEIVNGKLSGYQTKTEAETSIKQAVDPLKAEISLTAEYGSGTIGSNVRAMLTLFSGKDSSNIKLNADAIDLSAYVTFTSLKTAGMTEIDGGNIKASSITADKLAVGAIAAGSVLLNSQTRSTTVLTSEESSTGLNLTVYLGLQEKYTSGSLDYAQWLRIYGSDIMFVPPGAGESNSDALVANTSKNMLFPAYPGTWSLGGQLNEDGEIYYFSDVYSGFYSFEDGSYLDVRSGRLRFTNASNEHTYLT